MGLDFVNAHCLRQNSDQKAVPAQINGTIRLLIFTQSPLPLRNTQSLNSPDPFIVRLFCSPTRSRLALAQPKSKQTVLLYILLCTSPHSNFDLRKLANKLFLEVDLARRGVITCMCDVPKRSSRNTSLGHMKRPAFSAAPPRQTHWMNVSRAFDLLDKAIYLPLYIGRLLSGSCHVFVATV